MVETSRVETRSRLWFWISVLLVFAVFAAYATMRHPIPGANEPNYLSKAKNFWDPGWCSRDLYLQSGNSHLVFYVTYGWVTRYLSFVQTAWIGRLIVWMLLAMGWVRMTDPLLPGGGRRGGSLLAAVLFLAWSAFTHTNFAGEWVIGGVEGKGFAYAGLWLGIGALLQGRLKEAAIWSGLGVSFHPVVGVWSLLTAGVAVVTFGWRDFWSPARQSDASNATLGNSGTSNPRFPPWPANLREWIVPLLLLIATSLPGIVPAFAVLTENPGRELVRQADEVHTFFRLKHHLDASTFSAFAYQAYAVLLTVWLILLRPATRTAGQRWFARYVTANVLVALGGIVLAWLLVVAREFQYDWFLPTSKLLKFYLYRGADLLLPIAVALQLTTLAWPKERAAVTESTEQGGSRFRNLGVCLLGGVVALGYALFKPPPAPPPAVASVVTPEFVADWESACEWVRTNTPPNALFVIPRYNRNFKWYAQRAEYYSWKDCPQDAAGILEWNRRRLWLDDWGSHHFMGDRGSREDLQDLAAHTEPDRADYCILYARLIVDQKPVYRNDSFAVYTLAPGAASPAE